MALEKIREHEEQLKQIMIYAGRLYSGEIGRDSKRKQVAREKQKKQQYANVNNILKYLLLRSCSY